jgi:hypothetical protein
MFQAPPVKSNKSAASTRNANSSASHAAATRLSVNCFFRAKHYYPGARVSTDHRTPKPQRLNPHFPYTTHSTEYVSELVNDTSYSFAIMETKNKSLQKRFSAHVSSCFGVIRHDDELLRPSTPPPRARTFSLRRSSIIREQELVWKPYDAYSDMKSMAHGSEAQTHLTKSMTTGRVYVVKRFTQYPVFTDEPSSHRGDQPLPNEATVLLKALRPHPNILRAFGCDRFGGMISNLYTEHCSGGDLTEQMLHFYKINRTPPEKFVLHVFISLAHALCYIHNGLRWDPEEKVYWQEPGFNTPYIHADGTSPKGITRDTVRDT